MDRRIAIGALGLAAVGGYLGWSMTGDTPSDDLSDVDTSSVVEMAMGPEDAKVTLIEYASFTCPHCANFHKGPFKQLKTDYIDTGKIRFVYRDVYFDPYGLAASQLARCGGADRFFGIADMLYDRQAVWADRSLSAAGVNEQLVKIGKIAGLSSDEIEACMSDEEHSRVLVAWYQKNAQTHNVDATPTLVINEQKYSNMNYTDLKTIIEAKLAQ